MSRLETMTTLSESYAELLRLRKAVQGAEARLQIATTTKPDSSGASTQNISRRPT